MIISNFSCAQQFVRARRTSETVVTKKIRAQTTHGDFVLLGGRPKLWWHANHLRDIVSCSSDVRNCGVHAKNFTRTNNNFVILCSSDVRNCGAMQIFHGATLSSFRARRTSETAVTCRFFMDFVLVGRPKLWCTCKKFHAHKQQFRHFVLVGRPKLWWHANFSWSGDMQIFLISCSSDVRNCGDMQIFHGAFNPFLISCSSDVRNCGAMRIFLVQEQPFRCFVLVRRPTCKFWTCMHSSFCAHRTFETVVTFKFFTWGVNRFIVLCSWDVRNFGEMQIFQVRKQPFCHVVLVGRPKLRRDAKNSWAALFFRFFLGVGCTKP